MTMLPWSWKIEYILGTSFLIHLTLRQKWWACNLILFLSQIWRGTSRGLDRGTTLIEPTKFVVLNTSVVWPCIPQVHVSSHEIYTHWLPIFIMPNLHSVSVLYLSVLKILLCLWFPFPARGIIRLEMDGKKQVSTSHITNLHTLCNAAILLVATYVF